MSETVRVVVDAMGGDNAPGEIVKGAVQAVQAEKDIKVFLVGRQDAVNAELAKYTYDKEKIEVVHAEEVIEMAEPPPVHTPALPSASFTPMSLTQFLSQEKLPPT